MQCKLKSHSKINDLSIDVSLELKKEKIELSFLIRGNVNSYVFPKAQKMQRADELWKATCFELFLANDDDAYYELNFSSSLGWNFYVLDSYRAEPRELEFLEEPLIRYEYKNDEFYIIFQLESKVLYFEKFKYYNLATILLTTEKERTFWVIEHLQSHPDFHDKESFFKKDF